MKNKDSRGITLIALIITIVILLILAGVTIGTLQQSNIIGQAQSSAEEYSKGKINEELKLGEYEEEIGKYKLEEDNIEDGQLDDAINLKPGDIVNYNPIIDNNFEIPTYGTRTTLVDGTDNLTWKIWKIEDDNYIITPDTSTTRYLNIGGGASGYNDLVQILNAYCRKYYSDVENGVYARSVNMAELENAMTEAGKAAKNLNYNEIYNTIINPTAKTKYPGIYSLESSNEIGQSDSPSNDIYAPWSGDNIKDDGETAFADGYKITTYLWTNDEIKNNDYFDSITEELFFCGERGYWIASRSVHKTTNSEDTTCASFGSRGVGSDGSLNFFIMYQTDGKAHSGPSFAFKPVVTIPKSKILNYINK